jgi:hypothetical protein
MKTLVKKGVSLMILPDDTLIEMGDVIKIGPRWTLANNDNSIVLYENVAEPKNYQGNMFCFDGEKWSPNYNWRGDKLKATWKR